jgi:myo-inositol-1(or 4)-monophosphatase
VKSIDMEKALRTAIAAARAGGDVILGADHAALDIRAKSSSRDVVTQVDEQAQEAIVKIIQAAFPGHPILGEEGDVRGEDGCPYLWIVDPLDGTTNFVHGKTAVGTIIALRNGRQTILGVIYLPHTDELFSAAWGKGTFRNGNPVTLRDTKGMDDAVICGNIRRRGAKQPDGRYLVSFPRCASWDNYGSCAEAFAEILRGHNDGVNFHGPHLWDTAAGALLVEEAGGKAHLELVDPADMRGDTFCVASTKAIFEELKSFNFAKQ